MDSEHRTVAKSDSEQDSAHVERTLIPGRNGGTLALIPPGVSGNPAGRPTDEQRLVRMVLKRHPTIGADAADELAAILRNGDHRHWLGALREWLDRTEGTVQQSTHHHVSTDRAVVVHPSSGRVPELPDGAAEPPDRAGSGPEADNPAG